MKNLIMSESNVENIATRLNCCHSLLDTVRSEMDGKDQTTEEALFGVSDLLEMIYRDFRADIDCAEIYTEKAVGTV